MGWRFKWWYVGVGLLLGLVGLSFYRQAHRPVTLGQTLAEALRRDSFGFYLRPALPIVDRTPLDAGGNTPEVGGWREKYRLTTHASDAGHAEVSRLLNAPAVAAAIVRELDRHGYYHDFAVKAVNEARDHLQNLPAEALLNRMITADVTLLEADDDLADSIQTALLLTAMQPTGAVGCAKFSQRTIYVLTLADDNAPERKTYMLAVYAFGKDGGEAWTGTLEVPREWTPEQIFDVLAAGQNP